MAHYFLVLDSAWFHTKLKPALAASWRLRHFQPCKALCADQANSARRFAENCHVSLEGSPLIAVTEGVAFDRGLWRCLAGELLLCAAAEMPLIQIAPATLSKLLSPESSPAPKGPREALPPVQQAHFGSRDVTFGGGFYRPGEAGLNDEADVQRLAKYLASVNSDAWTTNDLIDIDEFADEEERAAELEFVRDWFPALSQLYQRANERNQVIICESQ